jgi:cation diffusion facilitator family transporter
VKILSGVIGHSYALIADGIESVLDIFGSLVIWGGLKFAALPPDDSHPYGHGKAESLAAVVVALTVIAAGLGLAVQSVREILTPHNGPAPFTLIVLVGWCW